MQSEAEQVAKHNASNIASADEPLAYWDAVFT